MDRRLRPQQNAVRQKHFRLKSCLCRPCRAPSNLFVSPVSAVCFCTRFCRIRPVRARCALYRISKHTLYTAELRADAHLCVLPRKIQPPEQSPSPRPAARILPLPEGRSPTGQAKSVFYFRHIRASARHILSIPDEDIKCKYFSSRQYTGRAQDKSPGCIRPDSRGLLFF